MKSQKVRRRNRCGYKLHLRNKRSLPRVLIHRSGRHVYAQIVDDTIAQTVCSASSISLKLSKLPAIERAKIIGKKLAESALKSSVGSEFVYDRRGRKYDGAVRNFFESFRATMGIA